MNSFMVWRSVNSVVFVIKSLLKKLENWSVQVSNRCLLESKHFYRLFMRTNLIRGLDKQKFIKLSLKERSYLSFLLSNKITKKTKINNITILQNFRLSRLLIYWIFYLSKISLCNGYMH